MKNIFLFFFLLFAVVSSYAQQAKPKAAAKPALSELAKKLAGSDLPYKIVSDSVAVIPYEGDNIPSYSVLVQKVSDLYIVYINLTEALPGKIDETKYKYLLQQNDQYDVVKIGMSAEDGTVYLRADLYKTGINTALLTRVIKQVANVANIIGGDLK
ncbi:MAG: hypothetical protein IPP72_09840 [Chitinophagaceae bacterium]|nr:hypothetical protein [Chitinophagaceae bacterium]